MGIFSWIGKALKEAKIEAHIKRMRKVRERVQAQTGESHPAEERIEENIIRQILGGKPKIKPMYTKGGKPGTKNIN